MAFSFFTKRTRLPSTRLRLLARYLQLSGILTGTMIVLILIMKIFEKNAYKLPLPLPLPLILMYGVLGAASCYQIGRGLLLRQRWAGYLALFTFGFPFVRKIVAWGPDMSIGIRFYPILMLALVASVWPELGSVRDSELADHDEGDDDRPLKRNRGFGEPKVVSPPMPDLSKRDPKSAAHSAPDAESNGKISLNARS